MNKNEGIIIKVAGPVVDVRFPSANPQVNEALIVDLPKKNELVLDVAFITGDNEVKALALWTLFSPATKSGEINSG